MGFKKGDWIKPNNEYCKLIHFDKINMMASWTNMHGVCSPHMADPVGNNSVLRVVNCTIPDRLLVEEYTDHETSRTVYLTRYKNKYFDRITDPDEIIMLELMAGMLI